MEYLSSSSHNYLNCDTLKLLNNAQIVTVIDFLKCENKRIQNISNLSLKEVLEIRKALLKQHTRPRNGYIYYQRIATDLAIIPTGIKALDILLEGGLFTGYIYEICGLPASGKTMLCFTLLKNIAPTLNSDIFYLDTKCDFMGLKIKQLLSNWDKNEITSIMNRIKVSRARTKGDFLKVLLQIKNSLEIGDISTKLIIIDSLPSLILTSYDQIENNAFLAYTANILYYLAKEFHMSLIVTNLVTLWNDGNFKNINVMKEKISCGNYWYGVPNARICLTKNKNLCTMKLIKAIKFATKNNTCNVQFTDKGFV